MDGFTILRFRGIDVRLNWSVVVIAALIAWSLAESWLPEYAEDRATGAYWAAAVALTAAFLVTLALHELSHSLTAHRHGVQVGSITLWLFGGVAVLDSEPRDPNAAFRIAAAGPTASVGIGLVALAVSLVFDGLPAVCLVWLGATNLVLALFNLLPAFPLDGGRIFHAWTWMRTGDRAQATDRAARVGLAIGAGLIALGVLVVVSQGNLLSGLWLVLIGWFLREAARAEWRHTLFDGPLADMVAGQLMTPDPHTVLAGISVENFIAGAFFGGRHAAYPVVDDDGEVLGLVTLNDVRRVPYDEIATRTVGVVMIPRERVLVVEPTMALTDLITAMGTAHARALVMDGSDLVGIISPSDIARLMSVVELAHPIGHEPALAARR